MAAILDAIDFFEALLPTLTPELRPGEKFKLWQGSEPMDAEGATKDTVFHRAFEVLSDMDGIPADTYLPLELSGVTITLRIGYLSRQKNRDLRRAIYADDELIKRNVLQPEPPGFPVNLYNIPTHIAGGIRDVSAGTLNAVVFEQRWSIHYVCAAV